MNHSKTETQIGIFWGWVRVHESQILDFAANPRKHGETLAHLHQLLHRIAPGLVCDVGVSVANKRQLIISAEGDQSLFPNVVRVVSRAPNDLDHFEVLAFRPATAGHAALVLNEMRLATDQIMGRVQRLPTGGVNIEAFVQGYTPDDDRYDLMVRLLLMHVLGEYKAVTIVKRLTVHPWPKPHEAIGLIPWIRLNRTVAEIVGEN